MNREEVIDILSQKSPRMFTLNPRSILDAAIYVHHVGVELHRAKYFLFKAITANPAPSPHNHLCELYRICDALVGEKSNDS